MCIMKWSGENIHQEAKAKQQNEIDLSGAIKVISFFFGKMVATSLFRTIIQWSILANGMCYFIDTIEFANLIWTQIYIYVNIVGILRW